MIRIPELIDQDWFEMRDFRNSSFNKAVWIPLRENQKVTTDRDFGFDGYAHVYNGLATLAIPLGAREISNNIGWSQLGNVSHSGYFSDDAYIPSDKYPIRGREIQGINLVLAPSGNQDEELEWLLHQDLIASYRLKREGDQWLAMNRGFDCVARLIRNEDDEQARFEMNALYLKDYLCARGLALLASSYSERRAFFGESPRIDWSEEYVKEKHADYQWEGVNTLIQEGGSLYSEGVVFHRTWRTDIDPSTDVPELEFPLPGQAESETHILEPKGKKISHISGAIWKNEWIEPADNSYILRCDPKPPRSYFVTDAEGKEESKETLNAKSRWLWFSPEVMNAITKIRGARLFWATRDTGGVGCIVGEEVHFGVNSLGLINVYAKDIAQLPDWQQRIWAGHSVRPDGKVSRELLAAQMETRPANTVAPEARLKTLLERINELSETKFGGVIFKRHAKTGDILSATHRFRATGRSELLMLAKDLARLTADSIDTEAIRKTLGRSKSEKTGSLKVLENLLSAKVGDNTAKKTMSPLFGIYELRLSDAHLPSNDLDQSMKKTKIVTSAPFVVQGFQMIEACSTTLGEIAQILGTFEDPNID